MDVIDLVVLVAIAAISVALLGSVLWALHWAPDDYDDALRRKR
jgi:hypothetical protein